MLSAQAADGRSLTLKVQTDNPGHLVWDAALEFTQRLSTQSVAVTPSQQGGDSQADIELLPLHALAADIPALDVLRLPFYYPDIKAVQQSLDGGLLELLQDKSRQAGWELLAVWDEGLRHFSGNRRFDKRINFTGMEFILLNPDPIAEKQFRAFDAWTRLAQPQSQQELLKQCLVGSRADTLQRIWHDRLDRVHLDISLSGHRYKGWVMVSPVKRWSQMAGNERQAIQAALKTMQTWQRAEARRREDAALEKLKTHKMAVHALSDAQRQAFRDRLPKDLSTLLPESLSDEDRQGLLAATAAVSRSARR